MVTKVSSAIALSQVRLCGTSSKTFFEEIKDLNRLKWLDEETLRAMIRTAVKEGSPGDNKNKVCLAEFV